MPAIGANGLAQRGYRLPVPKPAPTRLPLPRPPEGGHALAQAAPRQTAPISRPPVSRGSDVQSTNGYDTQRATAFKRTPAYHQAVKQVFLHQPPKQQAAILRGLSRQKGPVTPEGLAIRDAWEQLPLQQRASLAKYMKAPPTPSLGAEFGGLLKGVEGFAQQRFGYGATANEQKPGSLAGDRILSAGLKGADALIQAIPTRGPSTATEKVQAETAGIVPGQFGKNAVKDVVNMYGEALPSIAQPVGEALQGHVGQAANDVLGQYKAIAKDPVGAFNKDPVLTALSVLGPLHGISRLAAAPVRALAPESAAGRAVSTAREGVALTGNLTHERPAFSKSPTVKHMYQTPADYRRFKQAPTGELVPRSRNYREQLLRREIGQLASVQERIRRSNRNEVKNQRVEAVTPKVPARVAHAVTSAAKTDPGRAVIPGAEAMSLVADRTIRRPDTFVADLRKYIARVSANRPNLLTRPDMLAEHDKTVKALTKLADHPPKDLRPLFAAAEKYRQDFRPTQAKAQALGVFGDRPAQALDRRELQHYASTHMGAEMHPELGLVHGGTETPMSTAEIKAHINGPDGTGGKLPAYTPDYPKKGSGYYVSSERRPLPRNASNTLFAYTHGLVDTSHEALTDHHVAIQGAIDAIKAQNERLNLLAVQKEGGGAFEHHKDAEAYFGPRGLVPINTAQPFHPAKPLEQSLQGVDPARMEEVAARNGHDLTNRMIPTDHPGARWMGIDPMALRFLHEQQNTISPDIPTRVLRGANTLFREVALSTSAKHVPGVAAENLIRDIAQGIGVRSWLTGRRMKAVWAKDDPALAREMRARVAGGQVAGMTDLLSTHSTAEHYRGGKLYPFLKTFEETMKHPGPRQVRTVWKAWAHLVISGTKHALEENHQIAGMGKAALREHGYAEAARHAGFMGAVKRLMGLHGQMVEDAARGLYDPKKARQMRSEIQQMFGHWDGLTPSGKTAVMYSPFGMWWLNSARFLARLPVDAPVKTGLLASTTAGTAQKRQQEGLDLWSAFGGDKSQLPLYQQGGIPLGGGKTLAQNYYSPFGIMNDPIATGSSLLEPWVASILQGAVGVNWLGKPLTSPTNPKGRTEASLPQRAQYILNSALSSFIPLYTKAEQLAEGGSSAYDTNGKLVPFPPALKTPGQGVAAGAKKAFFPFKEYTANSGGGKVGTSSVPGFSSSSSGNVAVPGFSSGGGGNVAVPGF